MKLYHVTEYENLETIEENGLEPNYSARVTNADRPNLQDYKGVYGFTNLQNAIELGLTDYGSGDAVIVEFEASNHIDDPEYDGESKFVETDEPISAKLVWSQF